MEPMLLLIPGCPNSDSAQDLFKTALTLEGFEVSAIVREILTEADAVGHNFHGSPSFVINGADLFASMSEPAVSCRIYSTPNGFAGQPTLQDLRLAIRASRPER